MPRASASATVGRELRSDVLAGDIALSVRPWKRPRVRQGGRYRVGLGEIEVDATELVPFAGLARSAPCLMIGSLARAYL
jgi:hypothetical protein